MQAPRRQRGLQLGRTIATLGVLALLAGELASAIPIAAAPIDIGSSVVHLAGTDILLGSVSGHVDVHNQWNDTLDGSHVWVRADPVEGLEPPGFSTIGTPMTETDSAGDFVIPHVPVGEYQVYFFAEDKDLAPVWLGNSPYRFGSQTITVTTAGVTGVSALLPFGASIAGHVSYSDDIPIGHRYAYVQAWLYDPRIGELERVPTSPRIAPADSGGDYRVRGLAAGTYVLQASSYAGEFFDPIYWPASTDLVASSLISVGVNPSSYTDYDFDLGPRGLTVTRLGGADRFQTAAAISQYLFPPGSGVTPDTVWVANGMQFPDALSAGPAAALQGAPILLVTTSAIPQASRDELVRLHPHRIVVVGGTGVVSPAVFDELSEMVDEPPVRLGGADRYATSRLVVRAAYLPDEGPPPGPGAFTVFLADGSNFPDALSAGPSAANLWGPVVLVPGSSATVDEATTQLLEDLGAGRIYLAGGTASIGASYENSLRASSRYLTVARYGGADRYATSAWLSARSFTLVDRLFVATGAGFADAVAGAPAAALAGGPIVLSPQSCLTVDAAWRLSNVKEVVLLGGEASLGPEVEQLVECGSDDGG